MENVAINIMTTPSYRRDDEDVQTNWKLPDPMGMPQNAAQQTALELYLSRSRDLLPYLAGPENVMAQLIALCGHRMRAAEDFLQGLKEDPNKFLEFLSDVREHSYEKVLNYPGHDQHPWASSIIL